MSTKKIIIFRIVLFLLLPLLFIAAAFGYLHKERYLACITQNLSLCLQSKKYVSSNGKFIFRYPADYPITFKTGDQLISEYHYDDKFDEWVNFSNEFYPNAGGERLGSIIVTKHTPYNDIREYVSKELNNYEVSPKFNYVNIGGKNAVCFSLKQQPHSFTTPSYNCYIVDNTLLYRISFDYNDYHHKLSMEYYQTAQQLILSTLKFN